ncbi:hypothetical protein [Streptomyces sp. NBC_01451]|uniref:hypothetical protein n=1 Tax=Streptomyces sp. NBC_01451 TaxID=2903872 RepID=UPI003FCCFEE6
MNFVDRIDVPVLGNRGCLTGGQHRAVVIDPPRDVDRVIGAAARRGVRVTFAWALPTVTLFMLADTLA